MHLSTPTVTSPRIKLSVVNAAIRNIHRARCQCTRPTPMASVQHAIRRKKTLLTLKSICFIGPSRNRWIHTKSV